ncbi:hypothetical protein [Streptomyces sp. NPDC090022]|uniref:hypothetical protein n=1 Tax=Streptomyces sp. NPDC090022 TaxID=3365920 RepID=UPI003820F3A5
MRRKTMSAGVATVVAFGGWTGVTMTTADAAQHVLPDATCTVVQGPNNRVGLSGTGFDPGSSIRVIRVVDGRSRQVAVTSALPNGFFEYTWLRPGTYQLRSTIDGQTRTTSCGSSSTTEEDEAAAIKCTVTKGPGQTYGVSGRGFPVAETVTLKNSQGAVVNTTQTINDGFFEFTGVPNDTYTVTSKFAKVTCPKAAEQPPDGA